MESSYNVERDTTEIFFDPTSERDQATREVLAEEIAKGKVGFDESVFPERIVLEGQWTASTVEYLTSDPEHRQARIQALRFRESISPFRLPVQNVRTSEKYL